MKNRRILIFLSGIVPIFFGFLFYAGCKKTDSPFGIYAPQGLDVPSPTNTPLAGTINVFVEDGINNYVAGVTVRLVDPNGNSMTAKTGAYAAFNPYPLQTGVWTAEVYPQSGFRYGFSSETFSVTTSGQNVVTFLADNQTLNISPQNQAFTSASGTTYVYNVTYSQPGNLDVPATVTYNNLPSGFSVTPSSLYLNLSTPSGAISIKNNNGCYTNSVPITFTAKDFLNQSIATESTSLTKGYSVLFWMTWNGSVNSGTLDVHTINDCGYSWPITISSNTCGNPCFAGNVTNGSQITGIYVSSGDWTTVNGTAPNGSHFSDYRPGSGFLSGGVTFSWVFSF